MGLICLKSPTSTVQFHKLARVMSTLLCLECLADPLNVPVVSREAVSGVVVGVMFVHGSDAD